MASRAASPAKSYILGEIFLLVCLFLVAWQIVLAGEDEALLTLWGLAFIAIGLVLVWCSIALTVKRLHDVGLPGILAVCLLIPVVQWLALLFLMVVPGEPRPNNYGPPPFASPPPDQHRLIAQPIDGVCAARYLSACPNTFPAPRSCCAN